MDNPALLEATKGKKFGAREFRRMHIQRIFTSNASKMEAQLLLRNIGTSSAMGHKTYVNKSYKSYLRAQENRKTSYDPRPQLQGSPRNEGEIGSRGSPLDVDPVVPSRARPSELAQGGTHDKPSTSTGIMTSGLSRPLGMRSLPDDSSSDEDERKKVQVEVDAELAASLASRANGGSSDSDAMEASDYSSDASIELSAKRTEDSVLDSSIEILETLETETENEVKEKWLAHESQNVFETLFCEIVGEASADMLSEMKTLHSTLVQKQQEQIEERQRQKRLRDMCWESDWWKAGKKSE